MDFSSKLIERAVNEFAQLPGVGKKTALRFVLHMLKKEASEVENFSEAILRLKNEICFCKNCFNISDKELCDICSNPTRDAKIICVVQDIRDVMAIENTGLFRGHYHILGGIISPMDGIGPANLTVEPLVKKIEATGVQEIIMALPATMEGETTNFYIYKKIAPFNIAVSTIARGIAIGDELEYADEVTLGRSIQFRIPYSNQILK
ncbi:MAG: recombination mediator RecR [Bacteroidota bacterium]|nr:recombination mediator RecR [Bacteroidota bacterium]